MKWTVILLCLAFGLAASAEEASKPPACAAQFKGVIWNFGTDTKPDLRRCDGISYIPWTAPGCAQAAAGGSSAADPAAAKLKNMCEEVCKSQQLSCENSCRGKWTESSCQEDCRRSAVQCKVKC